jgi:hypothetical protein
MKYRIEISSVAEAEADDAFLTIGEDPEEPDVT